ncbi:MAG: signal recognition particle protein [Phycisphaeraceae bacterium]|nr:signal recognition particle protein [Phycisphaeraceae bacterium]
MFDRLTDSFHGLFRKISGKAAISESNVREAMEDVRTSLLEADVHYDVVESFCASVLEDALGERVLKSVRPGEQMVAIVHERLIDFLGGPESEASAPGVIRVSPAPTIVMMCGLQGSGKTTSCGKLAAYLKKRGRSVMICAADLQRPAAVEQLQTVAEQVSRDMPGGAQVHFYAEPDKCAEYGRAVGVAVGVCQRALKKARELGVDTLILDTAGRLHVNDELMGELAQVNKALSPHQIFLVVDAMTGQDAVNSAKAFHDRLEIDGVILTKFDSDTRGGAAISVKHVTGAPIRFIGVGEKLDALEEFHPERIAGRILGMGDVVSLVEKAQQEVDEDEAARLEAKMAKGEMTMEDFLRQLRTLRRMGPLKHLMGLLPGVGQMLKEVHIEDKQLDRVEAMIHSMTAQERARPSILNTSRKRRVARGSGAGDREVGQLVEQFTSINRLTKTMAGMSAADKVKAVKQMGSSGMGGMLPGVEGLPGFRSKGSTHTAPISSKFKPRKGGKKRKR